MRASINHPRGLLTFHLPSLSSRPSPLRVLIMKMKYQREMGLYGWPSPSGVSDKADSLGRVGGNPLRFASTRPIRGHDSLGGCSRCGERPSYYTRRYSGESLCAPCFQETTVEKVKRTISKYGMLRRGERVGVAVSGGKDSLSLLKILHELDRGTGELVALTVDEGVKGYRDEAIEHARALCDQLGVELVLVSYSDLFGFSLDQASTGRTSASSPPAACAASSAGGPSTRRR